MAKRKTTEQFVAEAKAIHGDKYDYSKVEYINTNSNVCIICPEHGIFWQTPNNHLCGSGCPSCYNSAKRKPVCGVGNNDMVDCPQQIYQKWISMLKRCYSKRYLQKHQTYTNCVVCKEWLTLSNFAQWFYANYTEGYQLDKDILIKGNKVYSPETCCFVPQRINTLLVAPPKGKYSRGVSTFRNGKYVCSISLSKSKKHLGCFDTQEDAFCAYKDAKEKYIKELAEKYFQEGKITQRVYDALMKYEVEITD